MNTLESDLKKKRVVFVTTKNLSYLRNKQEIKLLNRYADSVEVIGSDNRYYFIRYIQVIAHLLFLKKNFDIVFIGFAPQLIFPFKAIFKSRLVYIDFFISLYDTFCFDRKLFKPSSLMGSFLKNLDSKTLLWANCIITDTQAHAKYFENEFNIEATKFQTLYLESDTSIYYPQPMTRIGNFQVLYFGSILPLQGIEVIIDAIKLTPNKSGIDFVVIGPIPKKIKGALKNVTHVKFIEWLSQDELSRQIAESDLCLAGHFNKEIMKAKRTIPGKAYIYLGMKKPMILGENEANREFFHESNEGIYFVPMGDPKALSELILNIKNSQSKL